MKCPLCKDEMIKTKIIKHPFNKKKVQQYKCKKCNINGQDYVGCGVDEKDDSFILIKKSNVKKVFFKQYPDDYKPVYIKSSSLKKLISKKHLK